MTCCITRLKLDLLRSLIQKSRRVVDVSSISKKNLNIVQICLPTFHFSTYPTNHATLINFRQSSNANVYCTMYVLYIFQPSLHFAYHRWWLGSSFSYITCTVLYLHVTDISCTYVMFGFSSCSMTTSANALSVSPLRNGYE